MKKKDGSFVRPYIHFAPISIVVFAIYYFTASVTYAQTKLTEEEIELLRGGDSVVTIERKRPARQGELSDQEAMQLLKIEEFAKLGTHWSGLDFYEVYQALSDGDIENAKKLIISAAAKQDDPSDMLKLLIDLGSSDAFRSEQSALARITEGLIETNPVRSRNSMAWKKAEFLRGHIYETQLKDKIKAHNCYMSVLSSKKLKAIADKYEMSQVSIELTDAERGAVQKLIAVKRKTLLREKFKRTGTIVDSSESMPNRSTTDASAEKIENDPA